MAFFKPVPNDSSSTSHRNLESPSCERASPRTYRRVNPSQIHTSTESTPERPNQRESPIPMAEGPGDCEILLPIENISCQNLLDEPCTHCGWLRKRRTLKLFSWPQAYVVIHNGCVYYFRHEKANKAAGKFSLYGYNAVYRASEILAKDAPWCFKIVHTHLDFKTYFFGAASEQEMKVWMSKIKLELLKANGRSNLYGRNLQHVKEEKQDKLEDDPKFYEKIEANIYEDSSKFVPTKDYEKKCSIKKQNEDSDDEDIEINEAINSRPPAPLPEQDAFVTIHKKPDFRIDGPPAPAIKVPLKPPRVDTPPVTPPRPRKNNTDKITNIQRLAFQFEDTITANKSVPKSPKNKRRGSYVKTDGPGGKSPTTPTRQGPVGTGGGGSTGDEDDHSDSEEYLANFYFDESSKKASETIMNIGDEGVYLVRQESSGEGKVLVVFFNGQTKKYKIQYQHGMYFLAKEGYHHKCLDLLLKYYHDNHLPTISALLKTPYKLHPKYRP